MRAALGITFGLALIAGCSSVPDVRYLDDDGGSSGDGASSSGTSGKPFEAYACPDKPPAEGSGLCCGTTTLCRKCSNTNQCDKCARAGCSADKPCCARNAGTVDCRPQSECN